MKKADFAEYVQNINLLSEESLTELEKLVNGFPYCQTLEVLYLLNLYKTKNIGFQNRLKYSAALASNRKRLKKHIDQIVMLEHEVQFADEYIPEPKPEKIVQEKESEKARTTDHLPGDTDRLLELKRRIERKLAELEKRSKKTGGSEEGAEKITPEKAEAKKAATRTSKAAPKKKAKPGKEEVISELDAKNKQKSKKELIDQFIKSEPSISRSKQEFFDPVELAEQSIVDQENIVSETLAVIYANQGLNSKAIKIYRKLSLKYPEKSSYFAAQIEKLEKEVNN